MANTIYLPSEEDTLVTFKHPEKDIEIDLFDFDAFVDQAARESSEKGLPWTVELAAMLSKKYGVKFTKAQAYIAQQATNAQIASLKKKSASVS